jgi:hypothetical protein
MKLKGLVLGTLAVGMALGLTNTASAKDLCLLGNSATTLVGENLAIPTKGVCKTWAGFVEAQPGNILTGVICTSSDGTTVLANQFTSIPFEVLKSNIALPAGTGTLNDCLSTTGVCTAYTVSVVKCPAKPTIPALKASDATGEASSTFEQ